MIDFLAIIVGPTREVWDAVSVIFSAARHPPWDFNDFYDTR